MSQVRGRVALLACSLLMVLVVGSGGVASAETIQGHVLNADGTPVTDERVCVWPHIGGSIPFGASDATVSSLSDGSYTLVVAPGTYNLTFAGCPRQTLIRNDAPTYYGPTGRLADAVTVTVHDDEDVTGIDQKMRPGAVLAGHVYGGPGTGTPWLAGCMTVAPVDGPGIGQPERSTTTDENGAYAYTRLDPDFHYTLRADPCRANPGYLSTFYDGVTTLADASPVAPASGVDIHLVPVTPDPPADDDPADGDDDPVGGDDDGQQDDDPGTSDDDDDSGDDDSGDDDGPPSGVVAPPAGGSVVAPPVSRPISSASKPVARAAFGTFGAERLGTALRSGVRVPVHCAAACSATVVISVDPATAKRLELRRRTLVTGHAKLKAGTTTVLVVALPATVRRAFAHQKRATFTVSATAAGRHLRHTLTLKR